MGADPFAHWQRTVATAYDGARALEFYDKIPPKHGLAEAGVRVVPPGVGRYGSFLEPGVIPDAGLRLRRRAGRSSRTFGRADYQRQLNDGIGRE